MVQIDQHGRNVYHVPISNRAVINKQQRVILNCQKHQVWITLTAEDSGEVVDGRVGSYCFWAGGSEDVDEAAPGDGS